MSVSADKAREIDRLREKSLKGEITAEDYVRQSIELVNKNLLIRLFTTDGKRARVPLTERSE